MMKPDQRAQANLATFSIVIAQAKSDPELRDAVLADGAFRTIWPLIGGHHDKADPVEDTGTMNDISREELDAKLSAVEARMDRRIADFQSDMRQAVSDFRLEIQPLKGMKTNIWSATAVMVGTIIAVVGLSFTAFDSGRETSALVQEAKQQSLETRQLLEQIQAQQKALVAPQPTTSK
ncbi:hypothetical protein SAMN05216205_1227 [Pseudomonas mohnii]|uniref:Uncharacterized protein n=1 Tax=Pseudomonas mohnii TaxID=395600 RepID=A0ABY0XS43_9PSED|nr:hypothetical protein [Pseudomonas mohnii]SEC01117.1 hypothetical protein SAMN05216205_1227 [Pseudomonas mohnii]